MIGSLQEFRCLVVDGYLVALAMGNITCPAFKNAVTTGARFLFVFGHLYKNKSGRDTPACGYIKLLAGSGPSVPLPPAPFPLVQLRFLSSLGF